MTESVEAPRLQTWLTIMGFVQLCPFLGGEILLQQLPRCSCGASQLRKFQNRRLKYPRRGSRESKTQGKSTSLLFGFVRRHQVLRTFVLSQLRLQIFII